MHDSSKSASSRQRSKDKSRTRKGKQRKSKHPYSGQKSERSSIVVSDGDVSSQGSSELRSEKFRVRVKKEPGHDEIEINTSPFTTVQSNIMQTSSSIGSGKHGGEGAYSSKSKFSKT